MDEKVREETKERLVRIVADKHMKANGIVLNFTDALRDMFDLAEKAVREERFQCIICGQDGILQLCSACRDVQLKSEADRTKKVEALRWKSAVEKAFKNSNPLFENEVALLNSVRREIFKEMGI